VQQVAAGCLGGGNDRLDIEVGARPPPRNPKTLVGGADMQRQRVVRRVDRNGDKAGFTCGTADANGDLAAVGDQETMKGHEYVQLKLSDPSWWNRAPGSQQAAGHIACGRGACDLDNSQLR
jgi:hypothetical protein